MLYDDVQSIYRGKGAKRGLDFSFASVVIQAKGRTTILRMNYRNTLEILSVARTFATELLNAREVTDDGVPVITPESAGRRGAMPELLHCASEWHEWHCIAERILDAQGKGRQLNDIGVLYRSKWQAERIEQALTAAQIPYTSALSVEGRSTLYGKKDTVKIVSMHSSKGLEFGLVLIPGLSELPKKCKDQLEEARLLYVAMTRAVDQLVMTYHVPSGFSQKI